MFDLVSEFSAAQEDGGLPTTLSAGSAPGESGVSVFSAYFKNGLHIAADEAAAPPRLLSTN